MDGWSVAVGTWVVGLGVELGIRGLLDGAGRSVAGPGSVGSTVDVPEAPHARLVRMTINKARKKGNLFIILLYPLLVTF